MNADRFAARLRELREQAGLSQKDLAERVGKTVRTISRLETGVQEATWPIAVALAQALSVNCLAFLDEPSTVPEPKRGRPPKVRGEPPAEEAPKWARGRPKKEK